ncbi:phosphoribosyltransferase family protein [Flavisolibacter ginsenosidimutans]|uniref:Phosphoribosyltransferase n=1 Tax=Flavisolibacter ginsenosidimutans TaxID=661481 RepID=A0A5B8UF99_9BACT|nr:phosphoribosyltransferase family protein [Flavisolibacter ginsenosidimutans]QEC54809.1 phosphoribosyltransferase [Flavisolibacter ginsenosidimutans]
MNSGQTRTMILDEDGVKRKIKRMALEIAEQNAGEKEIVLAGIVGNGETVARCVAAELKNLASIATTLITVQLNKRNLAEVDIEPNLALANKIIIIADDVANTGKTMLYALKPFLNSSPKKIQTLVLVERSHKLFPVHTDYTGLSIATTLQEHITVEREDEKITGAWLY